MPSKFKNPAERRAALQELLRGGPVAKQQELVAALVGRGFEATQSSVSRDLKELGAIRSGSGYELPGSQQDDENSLQGIGDLLRKLTPAGPNMLVVKAAIGAAQRVALALDRIDSPDIVGTVAGDDTIFVATPGVQAQRRVRARLERGDAVR